MSVGNNCVWLTYRYTLLPFPYVKQFQDGGLENKITTRIYLEVRSIVYVFKMVKINLLTLKTLAVLNFASI